METRKQAILDALGTFVRQRSGLDYRNYVSHGADVEGRRAYFRAQRQITRDLHHYRELAAYVAMRDGITADALLAAARSAYSGRLTLVAPNSDAAEGFNLGDSWRVDYCTGQYFPTEYRRAACAVLVSAIWDYWRSDMPAPQGKLKRTYGPFTTEHDNIDGKTPGDWLRANARREFSRGIAARYFR